MMITGKLKRCNNNCIFCFIDQLPKGLRSSLYYKDDDFLSSFQFGNFVTLTNLRGNEIKKIIRYGLKPLNISIHSLDNEVRTRLFGNKKHVIGLRNLKLLDEAGIDFNVQIVLCPGINDGQDLINTVSSLFEDYKNVGSIGIVPVGITRYNKNSSLKSVDKEYARKTIRLIDDIRKTTTKSKNVFLSDEFYLLGDIEIPDIGEYDKLSQINNGIGKIADFLDTVKIRVCNMVKKIKDDETTLPDNHNRYLLLTSEYGAFPLGEALMIIKKAFGRVKKYFPDFDIEVIKNSFLGGNVKVTGLLTGKDIISRLKYLEIDKYERVFIPDCVFNTEGLMLDGVTFEAIKAIYSNLDILKEDLSDLFKKIYNVGKI